MHVSITVPLNVLFGQMAIVYCAYLLRQITLCGKFAELLLSNSVQELLMLKQVVHRVVLRVTTEFKALTF